MLLPCDLLPSTQNRYLQARENKVNTYAYEESLAPAGTDAKEESLAAADAPRAPQFQRHNASHVLGNAIKDRNAGAIGA